ncbi:MAG: hypothetical protein A2Y34_14150 [Spirochaetes bacterium GWC1_27_15]|nr:MAG: hypothetical protein A2Y34_14150 [Spirochaetes bacterium GWC1_27_15]
MDNKGFYKNLKKIFYENLNIKIICFILAIVTYFFIGVLQRNEKTFSCNLKLIGLKDYLIISNEMPSTVKVIVKDKKKTIDKITEEDFNIRLDLSNFDTTDNYSVKLKWDIPKSMKSFFSAVEIVPDKVNITIEKVVEKNVPVILNYFGNLEHNYKIAKTIVNPQEVRIQGPEKIVNKITYIETEKININKEKMSFRREVNLHLPYNNVKLINKEKIEVYFEISELKDVSTLIFKQDAINFLSLKSQFKISQEKSSIYVKVKGSKTELEKLSPSNIFLFSDCSEINTEGIFNLKIEANIPQNIEIVSISPEKIKITVEEKKN